MRRAAMDTPVILPKATMVAIVDDDEAVRDSLRMLLEFHGMHVTAVASAGEFWATTHERFPDCIILDLHLPDIGGREILKSLQSGGSAMPPVIVITGQGDRATKETVLNGGARAYLEKPFSEARLMTAISEALTDKYPLTVGWTLNNQAR